MSEIKVYIANLGKYNEGELVGAWFTPPIDFEEVKEKIGLNDEYEEFAIHDYEAPFPIHEYTSLGELNHLAELYDEIANEPYVDEINTMIGDWFSDLEDLVDHKDDIIIYDCQNMSDVAYQVIEEGGYLENVQNTVSTYFDYEAFGRDLALEGNFLVTNHGVFEYIG